MIDSHCHLNDSRFSKDLKHVLSHAQQSGIQQLIIAGVQHAQWATQLVLADKYKKIPMPLAFIHGIAINIMIATSNN